MKTLLLTVVCGLLAACVAPHYRQVELPDGGAYLLAQSPAQAVHLRYPVTYFDPLVGYGFHPWWSYTYYSPNFYPHYFSFWYPSWPGYYAGAYAPWYGGHSFGYRPYSFQPAPGHPGPAPAAPEPAPPPLVVAPAHPRHGQPRLTEGEDLYRNPAMARHRGGAFARGGVTGPDSRPAPAASSNPPTVRSLLSPARSHPALSPRTGADSPRAAPPAHSIERSHRPADPSPRHHDR